MAAWTDLVRVLLGRASQAPSWKETLRGRALPFKFRLLHVCPGVPGKKRHCGYVYVDKDCRPNRTTCALCGQYRRVQTGPLEGKPRLTAYVLDLADILKLRFAEPGFSDRLNPLHGQVHHGMKEGPGGTFEVDRDFMMEVLPRTFVMRPVWLCVLFFFLSHLMSGFPSTQLFCVMKNINHE